MTNKDMALTITKMCEKAHGSSIVDMIERILDSIAKEARAEAFDDMQKVLNATRKPKVP
jgi:hypothetical protein